MKRLANQTLKDNALPDKSSVHIRRSGLFYQIDQNLSSEILYKCLQHHKPGTMFMCRRLFPKDPSTDLVQLVVIHLNGCHVTSLFMILVGLKQRYIRSVKIIENIPLRSLL